MSQPKEQSRSTPVCEHKNQMWNIQFTHGHCKDCRAEFGVIQSESTRTFAVTEAMIDKAMRASIPGGSNAEDWFMPHEKTKQRENVRNVVRRMLESVVTATPSAGGATFAVSPHPAPDAAEPAVPTGEYREIKLGGSEFVGLKRAEAELSKIDRMLDKAGVRRVTPQQAVVDRVYDLLHNGAVAQSARRLFTDAGAAELDLMEACAGLINYWTRNLRNFQWEKADEHVKRINAALGANVRASDSGGSA